jgi:hypothetical protein
MTNYLNDVFFLAVCVHKQIPILNSNTDQFNTHAVLNHAFCISRKFHSGCEDTRVLNVPNVMWTHVAGHLCFHFCMDHWFTAFTGWPGIIWNSVDSWWPARLTLGHHNCITISAPLLGVWLTHPFHAGRLMLIPDETYPSRVWLFHLIWAKI